MDFAPVKFGLGTVWSCTLRGGKALNLSRSGCQSGFLYKESGHFSKGWEKRFVVLVPVTLLVYFDGPDDSEPRGIIVLDSDSAISQEASYKEKSHVLSIRPHPTFSDGKVLQFAAETADESRDWCEKFYKTRVDVLQLERAQAEKGRVAAMEAASIATTETQTVKAALEAELTSVKARLAEAVASISTLIGDVKKGEGNMLAFLRSAVAKTSKTLLETALNPALADSGTQKGVPGLANLNALKESLKNAETALAALPATPTSTPVAPAPAVAPVPVPAVPSTASATKATASKASSAVSSPLLSSSLPAASNPFGSAPVAAPASQPNSNPFGAPAPAPAAGNPFAGPANPFASSSPIAPKAAAPTPAAANAFATVLASTPVERATSVTPATPAAAPAPPELEASISALTSLQQAFAALHAVLAMSSSNVALWSDASDAVVASHADLRSKYNELASVVKKLAAARDADSQAFKAKEDAYKAAAAATEAAAKQRNDTINDLVAKVQTNLANEKKRNADLTSQLEALQSRLVASERKAKDSEDRAKVATRKAEEAVAAAKLASQSSADASGAAEKLSHGDAQANGAAHAAEQHSEGAPETPVITIPVTPHERGEEKGGEGRGEEAEHALNELNKLLQPSQTGVLPAPSSVRSDGAGSTRSRANSLVGGAKVSGTESYPSHLNVPLIPAVSPTSASGDPELNILADPYPGRLYVLVMGGRHLPDGAFGSFGSKTAYCRLKTMDQAEKMGHPVEVIEKGKGRGLCATFHQLTPFRVTQPIDAVRLRVDLFAHRAFRGDPRVGTACLDCSSLDTWKGQPHAVWLMLHTDEAKGSRPDPADVLVPVQPNSSASINAAGVIGVDVSPQGITLPSDPTRYAIPELPPPPIEDHACLLLQLVYVPHSSTPPIFHIPAALNNDAPPISTRASTVGPSRSFAAPSGALLPPSNAPGSGMPGGARPAGASSSPIKGGSDDKGGYFPPDNKPRTASMASEITPLSAAGGSSKQRTMSVVSDATDVSKDAEAAKTRHNLEKLARAYKELQKEKLGLETRVNELAGECEKLRAALTKVLGSRKGHAHAATAPTGATGGPAHTTAATGTAGSTGDSGNKPEADAT